MHDDDAAVAEQPAPPARERDRLPRNSLREIAGLFFRFGLLSFGGPPAQVALMEDELVHRRRWLDRQHFLDLYSAMNVIPGPNSSELAFMLGYVRAGLPGLLVAGVSFITPAVLIILPIAWAYVRYGTLPQLQPVLLAVNAGVIAILAVTFWRLATEAIRDAFRATIAILAVVAAFMLSGRYQPELLILGVAAIAGALWYTRARTGAPTSLPLLAVLPPPQDGSLVNLFLAFLKIGGTLYGSGYVLVSYLRSTIVEQHGWMSERELIDSIAVGQITPGPLLTTATFAGYLIGQRWAGGSTTGGLAGALVATVGIFLPSFVLVAALGGVIQRIRGNRVVRGALDGMNAAVAALILVVTIDLARVTLAAGPGTFHNLPVDPILVAVTTAAAVALLRYDLNATWIVAGAAIVGISRVLVATAG